MSKINVLSVSFITVNFKASKLFPLCYHHYHQLNRKSVLRKRSDKCIRIFILKQKFNVDMKPHDATNMYIDLSMRYILSLWRYFSSSSIYNLRIVSLLTVQISVFTRPGRASGKLFRISWSRIPKIHKLYSGRQCTTKLI